MADRIDIGILIRATLTQFRQTWRLGVELALFYAVIGALLAWGILGREFLAGNISEAMITSMSFWLRLGVLTILGMFLQMLVFFAFARRLLAGTIGHERDWQATIGRFLVRYLQVIGLFIFAVAVITFVSGILGAIIGQLSQNMRAIFGIVVLVGVIGALLSFACVAGPMLVAVAGGDDRSLETIWTRQRGSRWKLPAALVILGLVSGLVLGLVGAIFGVQDISAEAPWTSVLSRAVVNQFLQQLVAIISIAYFSVIYLQIIRDQPPTAGRSGQEFVRSGEDGEPSLIGEDKEGDHQDGDDGPERG